jgi:hypothetical protein
MQPERLLEIGPRAPGVRLVDEPVDPQIQVCTRIERAQPRDFFRHQRGFGKHFELMELSGEKIEPRRI